MGNWDEQRIQALLENKQEEKFDLEYKAADALKNKAEIRKDVSAMANSAGGVIFYGIRETKDASGVNNVPDLIEDVSSIGVSKETLEQVINEIKPRIHSIKIYPVELSGMKIYAVEVPEGLTAHMADDNRYYRRYNFQLKPMEDYEVRMTMNRSAHPLLRVKFYYEHFQKIVSGNFNNGPRLTAVLEHISGPIAEKIDFRIFTPRYWTDRTATDLKEKISFNHTSYNSSLYLWTPLFSGQEFEYNILLRPDFWNMGSHVGEVVEYKLWADNAAPLNETIDANADIKQIDDIKKR